uniref:Uncharacterized protein n=1 Tax=Arundo donax TaxID=35708 RepID=A0A0A9F485_ARUDO
MWVKTFQHVHKSSRSEIKCSNKNITPYSENLKTSVFPKVYVAPNI